MRRHVWIVTSNDLSAFIFIGTRAALDEQIGRLVSGMDLIAPAAATPVFEARKIGRAYRTTPDGDAGSLAEGEFIPQGEWWESITRMEGGDGG